MLFGKTANELTHLVCPVKVLFSLNDISLVFCQIIIVLSNDPVAKFSLINKIIELNGIYAVLMFEIKQMMFYFVFECYHLNVR